MFTGLSLEMCEAAFDIAAEGLRVAVRKEVANKFAGTLVVVNPLIRPSSINSGEVGLDELQGAILFQERVNDNHPNALMYDEIALTKARDLWVLMQLLGPISGLDIQQRFPHLYQPSMTKWHGSTARSGIPIPFSGVQGHFDQAFSETVDAWLTGMCRQAVADEVMPSSSAFIGGDGTRDVIFTQHFAADSVSGTR